MLTDTPRWYTMDYPKFIVWNQKDPLVYKGIYYDLPEEFVAPDYFRPHSVEYKSVMPNIQRIVAAHKASLVPGAPQLNWCDRAVMVSSAQSTLYPC